MDGESSTLTSITGDKVVAATIENGAPDGTKYIKTGSYGNNKYGEYCLESECAYPANTKADVMISLDVRFDADGAGFTPEDKGDSKVAGAVVLRNGTIQMQKGSGANDYTDTKIKADSSTWYHIALVGRYSASNANVDMYVWKYNVYNILFPDSSRNFFFSVFCRLISYKRISSKNSWIGCDCFGCCHSDMGFIHSAGCPDTFALFCIWHCSITHRIFRKLDFDM